VDASRASAKASGVYRKSSWSVKYIANVSDPAFYDKAEINYCIMPTRVYTEAKHAPFRRSPD